MIPASGGLMTAVNWSMSNMPRFETENVAPVYSFGCSRRPRQVHFGQEKGVGNGTGPRRQAVGDGLTDLREGDVFIRSPGALGMRDTGNGKRSRGYDRRAVEILLHDAATWP